MLLYILPEASDIGNFIPDIEKRGAKKPISLFHHWIFNLFLMTLLYPQNPYISRENAILIVKTKNRILKFKVTLYPIPPGNDLIP